jgi:RNA polymerase sigma factor (sigma-70 family)
LDGPIDCYREIIKVAFADMLASAMSGNTADQQALCHEYEQEVRIVARVHLSPMLRMHLDSMDITQSVHKSLLAGIAAGKFHVPDAARLVALACVIARRKICKKWRKHRRQQQLNSVGGSGRSNDWLSSLEARPESENKMLEAIESIDLLKKLVNSTERRLIDLRLAGLSTAQISQLLSIDPVAVRVRWSRLSAKLRKHGVNHILE